MISDYGTLKTEIEDYTHRTDLTDKLAGFIQHGIARINHDVRAKEMEQTSYTDAVNQYFSLPSDFLELRSVYRESDNKNFEYVTPEVFNNLTANNVDDRLYHSIIDNNLLTIPSGTAIAPLRVEINYYKKVAEMSADEDTSDMLVAYPNLFLSASMIQAMLYIQGDKLSDWMEFYSAEVERINTTAQNARFSGNSLVVRGL